MQTSLRNGAVAVILAVFCSVANATAQKNESVSPDKAMEYVQNGEWEKAVQAFEMITEKQPKNIRAWFQMGYALHSMKEYDRAIASYRQALNIGPSGITPVAMYNVGCVYALKGEKDSAFKWIGEAATAGFSQTDQLNSDADLQALRGDKRFAQVVKAVDRNARPCAYNDSARLLDFWVGDWVVYTPTGQLAGTSHIEHLLGDCVIYENWTSNGMSYTGKSFNSYDPDIGKWRQTWVDDKGKTILFVGEMVDSSMVFETQSIDAAGTTTIMRMSLTPIEGGKVRQFSEYSSDGKVTWTTNYDFTYVPKQAAVK